MTDKQWKITLDLIKKFNLNNTMLATVLGITKGTFSLKMNPEKPDKFSEEQKEKLSKYLLSMGKILVNSLGEKTK